ncbi:MAG: hypothetical protein U1G05_10840 [Kiritimatiellia bacterium]
MYNPATNELEYVRDPRRLLRHRSALGCLLPRHQPLLAVGRAVSYRFAAGDQLLAGEYALVCQTNPPVFRARYAIPNHVKIFGPYTGSLSNGGETLRLWRPGTYDLVILGNPTVQVEKVEYDDVAPWPAEADGLGPALERLVDTAYGNDPANWMARNAQGSPGGPPQIDSDGDTMPDNWEYALFRTLASNNFTTADRDGDSLTDAEEFVLGTSPVQANPPLEIDLGPDLTGLRVSFPTLVAGGPGYYGRTRTYTVRRALNPVLGTWTNLPGLVSLPATGGVLSLPLGALGTNALLRVEAQLP